jgi:pimeloyl-ACP methyl ester carboxylesterase
MKINSALAFLLILTSQVFGQELPGDWIGGFKQNDLWFLLRAQFQQSSDGLTGALDVILPAYHQFNLPQTRLTDLKISGTSIGFHHLTPQRDMVFDGKIGGTAITGTVQGKAGWSGPFALFHIRLPDETSLHDYFGTYQFGPNEYLHLQVWDEPSGLPLLYAFRESGELRALYPTDRDAFFAGPGAALPVAVESRIHFQRNGRNEVVSLTWQQGDAQPRTAKRVATERAEQVHFRNEDVQLAGTLLLPASRGKHPAIILVHGSGPESRDAILPYARFLVRRGVAILAYDKRGVGQSTGDWITSSYDDLAGDVVAALHYLKTRPDIDNSQIGLLGISQASGVMPLAMVREPGFAFVISLSTGAAPFGESDLDYTRNEMRMTGYPEAAINRQVEISKLLNHFLQTGEGWEQYAAALPPGSVRKDDPRWVGLRKMALSDSTAALEKLTVPILAIWGELDNITMPEKQKPLLERDLKEAGNKDYTLAVLPKGDHDMLESEIGSSAEMPRLKRFSPDYSSTVLDWLNKRVQGLTRPSLTRR